MSISKFNNSIHNKEKKSMQRKNVENRKATLEINGVSTDGFFALTLPNGKRIKVDAEGNKIEDNEVVQAVGGNIGNKKLYRRWVMAQFFRQFNSPRGYAAVISSLTMKYQWDMIANELKALAKLENTDKDYFEERTYFFNINDITLMLREYVTDLEDKIADSKVKRCKGVPYITIGGENVFTSDVEKKVLSPIRKAIDDFYESTNYAVALRKFEKIKREYLKRYRTGNFAGRLFKDAYKGAGAYYTLQNMVLYHDCVLNEYKNGDKRQFVCTHKGMDAYEFMKSLLDEYYGEGWRWTGVLKQCIEDNKFSFT